MRLVADHPLPATLPEIDRTEAVSSPNEVAPVRASGKGFGRDKKVRKRKLTGFEPVESDYQSECCPSTK